MRNLNKVDKKKRYMNKNGTKQIVRELNVYLVTCQSVVQSCTSVSPLTETCLCVPLAAHSPGGLTRGGLSGSVKIRDRSLSEEKEGKGK